MIMEVGIGGVVVTTLVEVISSCSPHSTQGSLILWFFFFMSLMPSSSPLSRCHDVHGFYFGRPGRNILAFDLSFGVGTKEERFKKVVFLIWFSLRYVRNKFSVPHG